MRSRSADRRRLTGTAPTARARAGCGGARRRSGRARPGSRGPAPRSGAARAARRRRGRRPSSGSQANPTPRSSGSNGGGHRSARRGGDTEAGEDGERSRGVARVQGDERADVAGRRVEVDSDDLTTCRHGDKCTSRHVTMSSRPQIGEPYPYLAGGGGRIDVGIGTDSGHRTASTSAALRWAMDTRFCWLPPRIHTSGPDAPSRNPT